VRWDVHLTRLGAGLTGTELARQVAARLRTRLVDAAAPGAPTVAIVPVAGGYFVVQCDGSVFRFGAAPAVGSARSLVGRGAPVVDAVATPDGGLWLQRADGSTLGLGTELTPAQPFVLTPAVGPLRIAAEPSGSWTIDRRGRVVARGGAPALGDVTEVLPTEPFRRAWALAHPRPAVVDAVAVPGGFYAITENGEVLARGAAPFVGDTADLALYTD
jgi:hypothetical protein